MKSMFIVVAALASLTLGSSLAAQEGPGINYFGVLSGEGQDYRLMARVCGLSEEQQQKITSLDGARKAAIAEFIKANGEKLKAASAALQEGVKSGDQAAIAKARKETADYYAPLMAQMQKSREEVMAILTPEQKAKWQKFLTVTGIKSMFARANLSDEQTAKIEAAYDELIQKGTDSQQLLPALQKTAYDLLTPEQKEALTKAPAGRFSPEGTWSTGGTTGAAVITLKPAATGDSGTAASNPATKPAGEPQAGGKNGK